MRLLALMSGRNREEGANPRRNRRALGGPLLELLLEALRFAAHRGGKQVLFAAEPLVQRTECDVGPSCDVPLAHVIEAAVRGELERGIQDRITSFESRHRT